MSCKKAVNCYSLGVFGLDLDKLESTVENTESAGFTAEGGKLKASCEVSGEKTCVVSVPYEEGFIVRVNGERTEYSKAISDFICFKLQDGKNEIEISFVPKGFYPGLTISMAGAALFALYIIFGKKIKLGERTEKNVQSVVLFALIAAAGIVYILPVILNLSSY